MRGEDLAKQAAATNKKGVVGRSGKIAPNIARPTKNRPEIFNKIFFNRFTLLLSSAHYLKKDALSVNLNLSIAQMRESITVLLIR